PYAVFYPANDILSWETAIVGGVLVLSKVTLKESATQGRDACVRYREITQEVFVDEATGQATGLGTMTWRTYERTDGKAGAAPTFALVGQGTIVGPLRIPFRPFYGGQRIA